MAKSSGSPQWKIYDANGVYQAACKEGVAAAAVVALYGDGATIRHGHSAVVWKEGSEQEEAGNSYDYVARIISERAREKMHAAFIKTNGQAAYDRLMGGSR